MINREKQKQLGDFIQNSLIQQGAQLVRNGVSFDAKDNAYENHIYDELNDALANLYVLFHMEGMYNPCFSVFNPSPSEPEDNTMFPNDLFLAEEQRKLEALELPEFIDYGRELVLNKKVPAIVFEAGLDKLDLKRIAVQMLFCSEFTHVADGYLSLITVCGGTAGKNKKMLQEVQCKADQSFDALKCRAN